MKIWRPTKSSLLLFFLLQAESAFCLTHKTKSGESFLTISQKYYGTKNGAALIAEVNHHKATDVPPSGQALTIPSATSYRIKARDSWEKIAKRITKDRRRAAVLAALNGKALAEPLREGQTLLLPFVVTIRVLDATSPSDLAKNLFGDAEKASLISEYNFRGPQLFQRGEKVMIPFVYFADPTRSSVAVTPPIENQTSETTTLAVALAQANGLYDSGQYSDALSALDRAQRGKLSDAEWIRIFTLRASLYVALGWNEAAILSFREILDSDSKFALKREITSPKILEALEAARKDHPSQP